MEEFMTEIRGIETNSDPGLSTAALAHGDTAAQRNYDEQVVEGDDRMPGGRGNAARPQSFSEVDEQPALFAAEESKDLRAKWDAIQVGFVDEPRHAVERADSLVAAAMKRLAEMFAQEREQLEGQWDRGDSVSTEELRLALRRYRAFFGRLLSV
jgi:hypothetical protein